MKFYAIKYMNENKRCTCGNAGKNGRYNLAVELKTFNSKKERDIFVHFFHADAVKYRDIYKFYRADTKKSVYERVKEESNNF